MLRTKRFQIITLLFILTISFNSFSATVISSEQKNNISPETNIINQQLQPSQNTQLSTMPEGGLNGNFTYGLRRLAVILAKNKDFTVDFVGYFKESDDKYKVIISSSNAWRSGNWRVDIYPALSEYEKVLDGYHCWFGFYDENRQRIGTAQAVKLKS